MSNVSREEPSRSVLYTRYQLHSCVVMGRCWSRRATWSSVSIPEWSINFWPYDSSDCDSGVCVCWCMNKDSASASVASRHSRSRACSCAHSDLRFSTLQTSFSSTRFISSAKESVTRVNDKHIRCCVPHAWIHRIWKTLQHSVKSFSKANVSSKRCQNGSIANAKTSIDLSDGLIVTISSEIYSFPCEPLTWAWEAEQVRYTPKKPADRDYMWTHSCFLVPDRTIATRTGAWARS